MIALFAAVVLAAPPPAGGEVKAHTDAYTSEEVAYAKSLLGQSNWRLVSVTPSLLVFTRPYTTPAGADPRVWLRAERYPMSSENPLGSGDSFVSVDEIDCASHRSRTLSSTLYSGLNMSGAIVSASDQPRDWRSIAPNDTIATAAQTVCGAAVTAPPADAAGGTVVAAPSQKR